MDQEQAGAAAVPCAGPEESADGNALGLPDLQPAVLDPPKQATHNTSSDLREKEISEEDRGTFAKQRVNNSRNSRSILSPLLIEVSSQLLRDFSGNPTNQELAPCWTAAASSVGMA